MIRKIARTFFGSPGPAQEAANSQQERRIKEQDEDMAILAAQASLRVDLQGRPDRPLREFELRVFSQFGDDGIIQHFIRHVSLPNDLFIEFGVQDYRESNTRFLLMNNNWRGLVIDGDRANVESIKRDRIYWRHDLTAEAAFITRDNIDELFRAAGFTGKIGLLSIDIDGNDYWVWERISSVEAAIVICEYNAVFGPEHAVSIPYTEDFVRSRAHYSYLYWGASLKALCHLGEERGYAFVGTNSAGNNAYFVRRDALNGVPSMDPEEGFVDSRFRESRDREGKLSYIGGAERRQLMADMPMIDVVTGETLHVGELG